MTLQEQKNKLKELSKQSNKLFKSLPDKRKEFDKVQEEIIRVLLNKKQKQMIFKF